MIINLTQHAATPDQVAAGVQNVANCERLAALLNVRVGGPDGFAAMNPAVQKEYLRSRAWAIVSEFVLPEVAQLTREFLASFEPYEAIQIDDVRALNYRTAPNAKAMVGGFMPLLDVLIPMLKEHGCDPIYALSDRVTVETVQEDGTVKKTSVFQHMGFYPA